jgi:hypothetical protein
MASLFWTIACSDWALGFDLLLLVAALVIGHMPFAGKIPAIAPYVVAARFAAYLVLAVMMLCIGHRLADESAALKQAQQDLAFQKLQLDAQKESAETAEKLRTDAEASAATANQKVKDYEERLAKLPQTCDCGLTDDDVRSLHDIAR